MSSYAVPFQAANLETALRVARARSQSIPLGVGGSAAVDQGRSPKGPKDERRRLRDEDQEKLAAAAQGNRPTQVLQKAERDYTPESRAFQRDARLGLAKDAQLQSRQDFRSALAQAREGAGASKPTEELTNTPKSTPVDSDGTPKPTTGTEPGTKASQASPGENATGKPVPPAANATTPASPALGAHSTAAAPSSALTAQIAPNAPSVAASAIKAPAAAPAIAPITASVATSAATTSAAPRDGGPTLNNTAAEAPAGRIAGARATKAAPAAQAETADPDANFDRILRVIRGSAQQDRGVATLRLDPPELGMLRLKLDFHGDTLKLDINTENEVARRLLSSDIDALRRELAHGGLHLEQVEVRVQPHAPTGTDASHFLVTDGGAGSQSGSAQTSGEQSSPREHDRVAHGELEPAERGTENGPALDSLVDVLA